MSPAGDQRFALAGVRAGQKILAGHHLLRQRGAHPLGLQRIDLRNAAQTVFTLGQPFKGASMPGVAVLFFLLHRPARAVDKKQQHTGSQNERAHTGKHVQAVPAEIARIGRDPPGHAQQAGDVHREKGQVEAAEHQPKHPFRRAL